MDNFTKQLIEEFGQGIVDHISRNRGKYAIGAGVAGLAGYGAYNGNLGSAINNIGNTTAGTLGVATSDLPYEEAPYGQIVDQGLDSMEAIYQAGIDPQVELEPEASFKVGQIAGNLVNSIHQGADNVRGMFEATEVTNLSVDEDEDEDEDEMSAAAATAGIIGGSAALLTGVAHADKIGKAATTVATKVKDTVKNAGDSVASSVKGAAQKTTTSIADVLLKTSLKLKDSKDTNDKAIRTRKEAAEVRTKESDAKKAQEKREVYNNAARLKEKLRKR